MTQYVTKLTLELTQTVEAEDEGAASEISLAALPPDVINELTTSGFTVNPFYATAVEIEGAQ